jgi:transposase
LDREVRVDQESWNNMANKHYPAQFKVDAVALYRSRPGTTIAEVADDLGVNRETLRGWVRAGDQRRDGGSGRPAAAVKPEPGSVEAENGELRRRVQELEEERDILRKAARYFAGETRW